jgi:hypothetical protein
MAERRAEVIESNSVQPLYLMLCTLFFVLGFLYLVPGELTKHQVQRTKHK